MDCRLPTAVFLPASCLRVGIIGESFVKRSFLFTAKARGFGTEPPKKEKGYKKDPEDNTSNTSKLSKVAFGVLGERTKKAPELTSISDRKSNDPVLDSQFLEKVESVRRSAILQKKAEEDRIYQPIDYDTPIESEQKTIGLGLKVGVGVAVLVFGLVFALGDFLPSENGLPSDGDAVVKRKLSEKEKSSLEETFQQFEETLTNSPTDPSALEGAAVTLVNLGEYERASPLLEKLIKERPENSEAYRLLGEVKFEIKDYEGSASAYRTSLSNCKSLDFEVLRGLTNALLAAKKPDEAVQVLLSSRDRISAGENFGSADSSDKLNEANKNNPIQVELLLEKHMLIGAISVMQLLSIISSFLSIQMTSVVTWQRESY
ncbi:hypothetical protein HPP92_025040 [Vanilla planifolia]|uniref:Uncharacterized protein n=1 Tax=Vanilla planifolia TaxID=51239 RepID=A0A835PK77_VANPL|nr:hypothetical protein HPP92_025040 [Vanilla planifolia]